MRYVAPGAGASFVSSSTPRPPRNVTPRRRRRTAFGSMHHTSEEHVPVNGLGGLSIDLAADRAGSPLVLYAKRLLRERRSSDTVPVLSSVPLCRDVQYARRADFTCDSQPNHPHPSGPVADRSHRGTGAQRSGSGGPGRSERSPVHVVPYPRRARYAAASPRRARCSFCRMLLT